MTLARATILAWPTFGNLLEMCDFSEIKPLFPTFSTLQAGNMSLEQAEEAMNSIHMPGATSASAPPTASPQPGDVPALPPPPDAAAPPPAGLPGPPAAPGAPTVFLQVVGMVTANVLADDAEYAEVSSLVPSVSDQIFIQIRTFVWTIWLSCDRSERRLGTWITVPILCDCQHPATMNIIPTRLLFRPCNELW